VLQVAELPKATPQDDFTKEEARYEHSPRHQPARLGDPKSGEEEGRPYHRRRAQGEPSLVSKRIASAIALSPFVNQRIVIFVAKMAQAYLDEGHAFL
jgi:hypothetical protein